MTFLFRRNQQHQQQQSTILDDEDGSGDVTPGADGIGDDTVSPPDPTVGGGGNITSSTPTPTITSSSSPITSTTTGSTSGKTTIQENIVRIQTFNHVSEKYDIIELIGQGSMGSIYMVRIKPNQMGGSSVTELVRHQKQNVPTTTITTTTTTQSPLPKTVPTTTATTWTSRLKNRLSKFHGGIHNNNHNHTPTCRIDTKRETNDEDSTPSTTIMKQQPQEKREVKATGSSINNSTSCSNSNNYENYVYALKTIRIDQINDDMTDEMIKIFLDEMVNEMNLLRTMDHPNIIKAHEIFMTRRNSSTTTGSTTNTNSNDGHNNYNELLRHQHMCIAMELCTGGNLYRRAPYTERHAIRIIGQILNAIQYIHTQHQIVHRDIKYENILFANPNVHAPIKLLDFGLSKQFQKNTHSSTHHTIGYMYDKVGTIYTMAPEILDETTIRSGNRRTKIPYTAQSEVWSIGVISYMLLSTNGRTKPFNHTNIDTMREWMIQNEGTVNYNDHQIWDKSDCAKDFVQHLLVVNPQERYTIRQALQHPFLQPQHQQQLPTYPEYEIRQHQPSSSSKNNSNNNERDIYRNIERSIQQYTQHKIFKKIILTVIAHNCSTTLSSSYSSNHQQQQCDNNNNNDHTYSTIDQLQNIYQQFDTERNGILSYDEFQSAMIHTKQMAQSSLPEGPSTTVIWNNDDTTTHGEDRITMTNTNTTPINNNNKSSTDPSNYDEEQHLNYTEEELIRIFTSLDINENGMIMYTEFLAATIEACGRIEDDRLAEAFDRLDSDDTGYISENNLREILGTTIPDSEIKKIIAASDKDQDGKISYSDFLQTFRENEL